MLPSHAGNREVHMSSKKKLNGTASLPQRLTETFDTRLEVLGAAEGAVEETLTGLCARATAIAQEINETPPEDEDENGVPLEEFDVDDSVVYHMEHATNTSREFARDDPEYFDFMIDVLRGR